MSSIGLSELLGVEGVASKCFYPDIVYVNTNETNQEQVVHDLRKIKKIGNIYMGVSGLYNFNIASTRDIDYILIFDASPTVKFFYKNIIDIIKNNDRKETLKKITEFIENDKENLFKVEDNDTIAFNAIKTLKEEIQENLSFLSSEEKFNKIKNIILKNHFHFISLDIYKGNSFDSLVDKLTENHLTIDTLYLSNLDVDVIKETNPEFLDFSNDANIISAGPFCEQTLIQLN